MQLLNKKIGHIIPCKQYYPYGIFSSLSSIINLHFLFCVVVDGIKKKAA